MKVPSFVLKRLYVKNSLKETDTGFEFVIKNTLTDATITGSLTLTVDNRMIPSEQVDITSGGTSVSAADISEETALPLKVDKEVRISVKSRNLSPGEHEIEIAASTKEYGDIKFSVKDSLVQ